MDEAIRRKILELLDAHRIMTVATVRPDGWPQATTVGYVNEGLVLYFLCGLDSQKARNLARDDRVSLTIDHDTPDLMAITGLSMAARAIPVLDRDEAERVLRLLPAKYPEPATPLPFPMPTADQVRIFRVEPTVISVLDYTQGFGHADLVACRADDGPASTEDDDMTDSDDSLRALARHNRDFRREVATGPHSQIVLMCLQPGEAIGEEVHEDNDQIFVVAKGEGEAVVAGVRRPLGKGELLLVPAGTRHDIRNTGDRRLRLVTIYAPPHHAPGTVHRTREDALRAEAAAHA
jgi:mannose-6-phosphate isomerase-like protein (cupin superfamily)/nitroimidazol reductase NimA-like FMN-containing flavoprotein (pyridoxamine 5'-phosphate oxidase superfamily)